MESVQNTLNNAGEAVKGAYDQATGAGKQEAGKQQAKNDNTLSGKAEGAKDYVTGTAEKKEGEAKKDSYNPLS